MFYSQLILAKKGPLGTIWIAAHLERKLRKNQVTETNISVSVDSILFPEAPIALRLSGHLLLGVVRIYSRKVNYLFHDCSEALTKIKQAFHSGAVDLPPESTTAPYHAITLPENFDLDEFEPLGERESMLLATGAVDQHVTTRELITLQDNTEDNIYFGSQYGLDDRLPQVELPRMGLDFEEFKSLFYANLRSEDIYLKPHMMYKKEYDLMENLARLDVGGCGDLDFSNSEREKAAQERDRSPRLSLEEEVAPPLEGYRIDFDRLDEMEAMDVGQLPPMTPAPPAQVDVDIDMEERPEEMPPEDLEQLPPVVEQLLPMEEEPVAELAREEVVEVPDELVPAIEAAAEQMPAPVSPAPLPMELEDVPEVETLRSAVEPPTDQTPDLFAFERETARSTEDQPARDIDEPMVEAEQPLQFPETVEELRETSVGPVPGLTSPRSRPSLAPSDIPADDDVLATLLGGRTTPRILPTPSEAGPSTQRPRRAPKPPPRKRKPVIDAQLILNGDQMRQQLADTSDIRRVRKKAPCTRVELLAVERLQKGSQVFNEPSVPGLSNVLRDLYARVLVPGRANLPLAEPVPEPEREPEREATPEVAPATPRPEVLVEEPGTAEQRIPEPEPEVPVGEPRLEVDEPAEEPYVELPVMEPPVETQPETQPEAGAEPAAEVDVVILSEETPGFTPAEGAAEFPLLETEPGPASEPQIPFSAPEAEPILIETEGEEPELRIKDEETRSQEAAPEFPSTEEDVEVTGVRGPSLGEAEASLAEQPEFIQEVAAEAEAVAEAVAEGAATLIEGVDGRAVIVLEDDGTIIDEGPSPFTAGVKEEIPGEVAPEEELGFLGEPRETVFLQDDDDDLHEEPESWTESMPDVTVEGFSGWSARTRAVGGYLQGVFEGLGARIEQRRDEVPRIGIDHTLRGKTRKEAARLFFETLVLKTKDYVDVEQPVPYGEVYLSARPKLLKGSF